MKVRTCIMIIIYSQPLADTEIVLVNDTPLVKTDDQGIQQVVVNFTKGDAVQSVTCRLQGLKRNIQEDCKQLMSSIQNLREIH